LACACSFLGARSLRILAVRRAGVDDAELVARWIVDGCRRSGDDVDMFGVDDARCVVDDAAGSLEQASTDFSPVFPSIVDRLAVADRRSAADRPQKEHAIFGGIGHSGDGRRQAADGAAEERQHRRTRVLRAGTDVEGSGGQRSELV
jgi:hypothetical protein